MNPQNSRKLPPFLPKMNIFEKFNKNDQNNILYQKKILSNAIRWCKLYLLILNNKKSYESSKFKKTLPVY
jgi:hypothetical protein